MGPAQGASQAYLMVLNFDIRGQDFQVPDGIKYAIANLEHTPELLKDGVNGTYLYKDTHGRMCGIFKPRDEEAGAPNNTKQHRGEGVGPGLREGVAVGDGAIGEYTAYVLDSLSPPGLRAGVPPTV